MNPGIVRKLSLGVAVLAAAIAGNLPAADSAPAGAKGKPKAGASQKAATRPDPVKESLNAMLAAASAAWSAGDFQTVRARCGQVLATTEAPAYFRSYAHLRIARSYVVQKNSPAALAEYAKIQADASYPWIHRQEAQECAQELQRLGKGLPARDAAASRTKVAPVTSFVAEVFVAPDGSDSNPGTREKPFASLEKARDAVRALKAQSQGGAVAVRLLPGVYEVKNTFELSAADSGSAEAPIVYRADKPGTAVLYGGKKIGGFAPVTDEAVLNRLPAASRGKVVQCDLRRQGVADLSPLQERGYGRPAPKTTLELFFNGEPQTIARWPDNGFVNGGRIDEPGDKKANKPSVFEYLDDRHARWAGVEDAWLYGYFRHGWAERTLKIRNVDPASKKVTCDPYELGGENMKPVSWFNSGKIKYFVFNLLEELDQPGEWYLNRHTGVLYLYPPSDPSGAVVEIGMLAVPMLSMNGVSNVRVEGLVFDLSRSNCMTIANSEKCLVAGCTVKRFAGSGILIRGGRENGILGCDIYSLGRRATEVIGGDRKTLTPGRHFVENCWMHSFGRLDHTYVPAVQLEGCGNRVAHNLFGDCPSSTVRIEGNDHLMEYNRVYRALLESEDQGGMELFGNPTYRGIVFRYNYFSDMGAGCEMHGSAGRAGIRLDDAISGVLVYGNIFQRAAQGFGGLNINGGRDNLFDNNIFAECEKGITGGYSAGNKHWQGLGVSPEFILSELYLERYPELKHVREQPGLNNAWRNVFWKCGPAFSTYGRASEDKFNLLANVEFATEDPGFANAAQDDFSLRPDAPLTARMGFRPVPVDEIGLYKDDYRASWPVKIPPGPRTSKEK